jgi:hypothetical protein
MQLVHIKNFYRAYVSKDVRQTTTHLQDDLLIPFDSIIYRYNPHGGIGPDVNDWVSQYGNKCYILHRHEYQSLLGRPKHVPNKDKRFIRDYTKETREVYRPLTTAVEEVRRENIVVMNYNPIPLNYIYPRNSSSNYYKHVNMLKTIIYDIQNSPAEKPNLMLVDLEKSAFQSKEEQQRLSSKSPVYIRQVAVSFIDVFYIEVGYFLQGRPSMFDILDDDKKMDTFLIVRKNGRIAVMSVASIYLQIQDEVELRKRMKSELNFVTSGKLKPPAALQLLDGLDGLFELEEEKTFKKEEALEKAKAHIEKQKELSGDLNAPTTPLVRAAITLEKEATSTQMTQQEYRRYKKNIEVSANLKSPLNPKVPLVEDIKIADEDLDIKEVGVTGLDEEIIPKEILNTKVTEFDNRFVGKIMDKLAVSMIYSLQSSGAIITNITKRVEGTVMGETDVYEVTFNPIKGTQTTVPIRMPRVDADGTFTVNGTKYRMKKQHGDIPIRKIGPYEVVLTSYYGKLFVRRSTLVVNSKEAWFDRAMSKMVENKELSVLRDDVYVNDAKTPYVYGIIARRFRRIQYQDYTFNFSYKDIPEGKTVSEKKIWVGTKGRKDLYLDKDGMVTIDGSKEDRQHIFSIFNLPSDKADPLATIRILSKEIPVVLFLMFLMGLTPLLEHLKVTYKLVKKNKRYKKDHWQIIKFTDVSLVIVKASNEAKSILQGLVKMKKSYQLYEYAHMDINPDTGLAPEGVEAVLNDLGLNARFMNEMEELPRSYLDPITVKMLGRMKEPTEFLPLIFRAVSLLDKISHEDPTDSNFMREKGYERFLGIMYQTIIKSVKAMRSNINVAKRKIDIGPYDVLTAILQDSTVKPVEDVNPIGSLKEREMITYLGAGGRTRETMTAATRIYHPSNDGRISEAVPDSGAVGINASLSADPNLADVFGMPDPKHKKTMASRYSTHYLASPGLDKDDPRRAVMSSIQQSHVVAIKKPMPSPIRTGMEYVIPHRVGPLYANMAKQDGVVTKVTPNAISVKYKDGTTASYPLGKEEGTAEGKIYTHELVSSWKKGDRFKKEDALSYNKSFFTEDTLFPGKLIYQHAAYVPMAFLEGPAYHEDSMTLHDSLKDTLGTTATYMKVIVVDFENAVVDMVKVGDRMEPMQTYLKIQDAGITEKTTDTIDTILSLGQSQPTSKVGGTVSRIVCYYNGEVEEMSKSLQKLVEESDARLIKKATDRGQNAYTGDVEGGMRIGSRPLGDNQVAIVIYLESDKGIVPGDKFIAMNQLKATVSKVDAVKTVTQTTNEDILFGFSLKAALARMTWSGITIPMAARVLYHLPSYLLRKYLK